VFLKISTPPTSALSGFSGFSTVRPHPNCRCYRQTPPVPTPAPKQPGRAWTGGTNPGPRGHRGGPTASPCDPSPREECGGGCCVSACLSAHPRRAAFPPSSSSQPCDRTIRKLHISHAWQLGRARATSTVSYTLPAYNYKYGTTIRHGTRSAVSSGVASMTDRLRPKPSVSIYPDRVSGNRTHALSVWTYVTACRCGVHAQWAGSSGLRRKFGTTAVTRRPHPVLVLEVASFAAVARSG
jgi:hypothetical protein